MDEINSQIPSGEFCEKLIKGDDFQDSAVIWIKDPKGNHYQARLRESVHKRTLEVFQAFPAPLPFEIMDALHNLGCAIKIEQNESLSAYRIEAMKGDRVFTAYTQRGAEGLLEVWSDVKQSITEVK